MLQPLRGQPLCAMFQAVGQAFEFGERRPTRDRRGKAFLSGDYVLKFVAADWRIIQDDRIILGSTDHSGGLEGTFFCESEEPPEQEPDIKAWHRGRRFLQEVVGCKYTVESVNVGRFADVTVNLSDNLRIESFSSTAESAESCTSRIESPNLARW
jgi:hypothetical protein